VDDKTYHAEYADENDAHLTHEEIINMLNREYKNWNQVWTFEKITDHRKVKWKLKNYGIEGRRLWKPLNVMEADDPVNVA